MGEMNFSLRDIYPNMAGTETSLEVNPEADDREALTEDANLSGKASHTQARGKTILLAGAVMIALVVFLGIGE